MYEATGRYRKGREQQRALERKFRERVEEQKKAAQGKLAAGLPPEAAVRTRSVSMSRIEYEFWGETFSFSTMAIFALALAVGLVGGVYGIGGGAIIAPFVVSVLGLPVYTVAGAALAGTFLTSIAGVAFFEILATTPFGLQEMIGPDWVLGALFGAGGLAGTYVGARFQKYPPEKYIRVLLGLIVTGLALQYVIQFFT